MKRIYWVLGSLAVLCCLGQTGQAIIYNDGGVYEINTPISDSVEIYDGPASQPTTVELVAGGSVRDVDVFQNSNFLMSGGTSYGLLLLRDTSRGEISGGVVDEDPFAIWDNSQLTITGSYFDEGLSVRNEGQVFIYGSDFQIDGVPVPYGPISVSTGRLEGTLLNGQIRSNLDIQDSGVVTLVPEPASLSQLLLGLGLGTVLVRRKRYR